jgi:hypothetical protein
LLVAAAQRWPEAARVVAPMVKFHRAETPKRAIARRWFVNSFQVTKDFIIALPFYPR